MTGAEQDRREAANSDRDRGAEQVIRSGSNALHRLYAEQGQSPWIDFIDRDLIASGKLAQMVDDGIRGLRGHTSGYCIPTYVIDAPGGGGKVPLQPDYFQGRDEQGVVLRNYENRIFHYPDQTGEAPCSLA